MLEDAKATRRGFEQLNECGGKNMLTRVLLHVIEPSQPINFTVDRVADLRNLPLDYMQDAGVFGIDAINHAGLAKRPDIGRLSADGRIKRRAIKCDCNRAIVTLAHINYTRVKFEQA